MIEQAYQQDNSISVTGFDDDEMDELDTEYTPIAERVGLTAVVDAHHLRHVREIAEAADRWVTACDVYTEMTGTSLHSSVQKGIAMKARDRDAMVLRELVHAWRENR